MKKIIMSSLVALGLLCTFSGSALADNKDKCEDYHRAIQENCFGGTGGIESGGMGACLGAQLGAWIAGC
ncbi:hypothetical protein V2A85_19765 [Yersinia sp. 1252 StPb PI]|uniref:hypothetical protein n=1 Tax=Yersinia sp. 1252 StPb PI TaxID=3117404 RepID=UPI003B27C40E